MGVLKSLEMQALFGYTERAHDDDTQLTVHIMNPRYDSSSAIWCIAPRGAGMRRLRQLVRTDGNSTEASFPFLSVSNDNDFDHTVSQYRATCCRY
jgi:hypothetical protein